MQSCHFKLLPERLDGALAACYHLFQVLVAQLASGPTFFGALATSLKLRSDVRLAALPAALEEMADTASIPIGSSLWLEKI